MNNWLLSFLYALGRFSLGLLFHPYQTMQLLVEQKIFVWLTLLPTVILGLLTVVWKIIILSVFTLLFKNQPQEIFAIFSFLSTWVTIFIMYWQIMLFYLLIRFRLALED